MSVFSFTKPRNLDRLIFWKESLNPVKRLRVQKSLAWATAKPSRERPHPPPPFVLWSKGLLGKTSREQFYLPCTLCVSLLQRVLGKRLQPPCPLGSLWPRFSLGEALWSRYSDSLNPCHTLPGCPWVGEEEVETGNECCLDGLISWLVPCRMASPSFNHCFDAKWLHTVLARLGLMAACMKVRQIAFVALSNTSWQRLFYVKEETLWLNCSLGIFRAVTMLTKFHTFHLQDMQ